MTDEAKREHFINELTEQLRRVPFTFEVKVVKKPKGIKIIQEVTREELDAIMQG